MVDDMNISNLNGIESIINTLNEVNCHEANNCNDALVIGDNDGGRNEINGLHDLSVDEEQIINEVIEANPVQEEHGLSNLLNFDSEQLIRLNSADQNIIRLSIDSEDLKLSNLSITN